MKLPHFLLFIFFCGVMNLQGYPQNIKVMTYNIYHGENPYQRGKPNLDSLANLIHELNPDIVALQEVDSMTNRLTPIYWQKTDLVKDLAKQTGMQGYFAKAMDYSDGGYGEGILVKRGADFETQLLPTPKGGEPRSVAWARLNIDQKTWLVGGTHLCHEYPENRLAQVASILNFVQGRQDVILWMGDLNFKPDSEEYHSIPENWLDAGQVAKNTQATYSSESYTGRIDYIWYNPEKLELISYEVLNKPFSDHYPIIATFRFK